MLLPSATTASSSAMSGQTASSFRAACDAEAVTYTRSAARKGIYLPPQHAATVGWQIIGAADMRRRRCRKRSRRGHPGLQTGRVFSSNPTSPGLSFAAVLRGRTEEQKQPRTYQVAGPDTMEHRVPAASPQYEQQKAGQPGRAPNINSLSLDKMLKVVIMVVQQTMAESNGAVLGGQNIGH
jgi:hypothetical protein